MEDGLRGILFNLIGFDYGSLNPCFNGRWSASPELALQQFIVNDVLILVLMEDGLRE